MQFSYDYFPLANGPQTPDGAMGYLFYSCKTTNVVNESFEYRAKNEDKHFFIAIQT
jgi:hypothetical protein